MPTISEVFAIIPDEFKQTASELVSVARNASVLTCNINDTLERHGRVDLVGSDAVMDIVGMAVSISCFSQVRTEFGSMEALEEAAKSEALSTPRPAVAVGRTVTSVFETIMKDADPDAVNAADKISTAAMHAVAVANRTFARLAEDGLAEVIFSDAFATLFGRVGFLINYCRVGRFFATMESFYDAVYEEARAIIRASEPSAPKVVH